MRMQAINETPLEARLLRIYFMVACFLAYFFSGHTGIYASQRIGTPKMEAPELPPNVSLKLARELKPDWNLLVQRVKGSRVAKPQNTNE